LWEINQLSQSRELGKCVLVEIFYKAILSKFNAETAEDVEPKYEKDFLTAIHQLQLTDPAEHSSVVLPKSLQQALADAFDSEYCDPFGLVSDYIGQLRQNMQN
jgi:hypothetical protein